MVKPEKKKEKEVVVDVNHFQISTPKPLGQSKPNFIWSLLGKGERKFI